MALSLLAASPLDALLDGQSVKWASLGTVARNRLDAYLAANQELAVIQDGEFVTVETRFFIDENPHGDSRTSGYFFHGMALRDSYTASPAKAIQARVEGDNELCVSPCDSDSNWFTPGMFGVIFFGTTSADFGYDCHSYLCPITGRRVTDDSAESHHRAESWLSMDSAVPVAVIVPSYIRDRELADIRALGLDVIIVEEQDDLDRTIASFQSSKPLWQAVT